MKREWFLVAFLLALVGPSASLFAAETSPLPAYLPGLVQSDPVPHGCVDCHVLQSDGTDRRLSKMIELFKNHPDLTKAFKGTVIPDACLLCHKTGSKLGSLGPNLHMMHYGKKSASDFVKNYAGSCLNCHTLDVATGKMGFKTGIANW